MDKNNILRFLDALRAENVHEGDEWIRCSCPLAPWRHAKGTDTNPSFGIKINEDGASGWYCFSCELGGRLQRLIHAICWNSGEYPWEAAEVVWDAEWFLGSPELHIVRRHPRVLLRPKAHESVPDDVLAKYPLATTNERVLDYLIGERRISLQSIADYQLRILVEPDGKLGVVFPIIARNGKTMDLYVRMIGEKIFFRLNATRTGSAVDYKCTHLLFGEHLIQRNVILWLGEAPLDVLRLRTLGIRNVGATCGPPKEAQLKNIYNSVGVIAAFDADEAGRRFVTKTKKIINTPSFSSVDWGLLGKKDGNQVDDLEQVKYVLRRRTVFW